LVKETRLDDLKIKDALRDHVAPELYLQYFNNLVKPGIRQSARNLISSIMRKLMF
jgi:hypothetical protein